MYADFIAVVLAYRSRVLEDHDLQVSSLLMMEDTPSIVLNNFVCNLEAHVLALMQSAPPIEADKYRLPKEGKTKK